MSRKVLIACAVSAILQGYQISAHADLIYEWSGTCSSRAKSGDIVEDLPCTGTFQAQLRLIDSYVPGTMFFTDDVIELTYTDDVFTFTETDFMGVGGGASGTLPVHRRGYN